MLNNDPCVSIVMAVYNGAKFIQEALDSALAQTYPHLEIIIVNDGSTDSTQTILDQIYDERVKVIHFPQNQGAANALNAGIAEAKGSWIAIHDADDNSYPTKIAEQVKYINEHPLLVGVGTLAECIAGDSYVSDITLQRTAGGKNCYVLSDEIRRRIYWGCPLFHSSVIFARQAFEEIGGYNPEFKIAYDYDLWLRLLERGEIEKVPKVLLQYRVYHGSLSNKDELATVNEIQKVSSQAIYRFLGKKLKSPPKVIVIGTKKACKHYKRFIGSASGLEIDRLIYEDWKKQIPQAVNSVNDGKVAAIIVLGCDKKERILDMLASKHLKINQQVFSIYNILR